MNSLMENIERIHTTVLGAIRIKRNLKLEDIDVVEYCKELTLNPGSKITKEGKNWYVQYENKRITINSYSYTIITAHLVK